MVACLQILSILSYGIEIVKGGSIKGFLIEEKVL